VTHWLMDTILVLPAVIVALSFHEYAHAKVATLAGDPTPEHMGRVTIDPRAHIDPIGLLSLIVIRFGWGRPVVVNPSNFGNRRRDSILVGLAGVSANFAMAVVFGLIISIVERAMPGFYASSFGSLVGTMLIQVVIINIALMLFNLLPVPPLDGFGVLADVFNLHGTRLYETLYRNSLPILLVAIMLGLPSRLLSGPLIRIVDFIMSGIIGLPGWWILLG
jgi:Zn-dependent protease